MGGEWLEGWMDEWAGGVQRGGSGGLHRATRLHRAAGWNQAAACFCKARSSATLALAQTGACSSWRACTRRQSGTAYPCFRPTRPRIFPSIWSSRSAMPAPPAALAQEPGTVRIPEPRRASTAAGELPTLCCVGDPEAWPGIYSDCSQRCRIAARRALRRTACGGWHCASVN